MKTLLITGAAGDIGTHLRRELAGVYNLRLSDIRPVQALRAGETFVQGDIAQMPDMLRVTAGLDAILHLGGVSAEADWEAILEGNIVGCYNVFEAARRNGVKRVLFATFWTSASDMFSMARNPTTTSATCTPVSSM